MYCVIYFEDGCVRSRPFPHQSLDRQGIQEGEPIQGRVTLLPGLVRQAMFQNLRSIWGHHPLQDSGLSDYRFRSNLQLGEL